jgi:hypothetical protein
MTTVYGALKELGKFVSPKCSDGDKKEEGDVSVSTVTLSLYKFTAVVLLGCSILVTSNQFFGENIHCMVQEPMSESLKMFESFCFMKSTFTMPPSQKTTAEEYAHPGVARSPDSLYRYEEDDHVFHNYYQWVCFVLFLQAVACYLPWFCWKHKEGGFVWRLVGKVPRDLLTTRTLEEQVGPISGYLAKNKGQFDSKARFLLLTRVANLVIIVVQMYIVDIFLGGHFLSLGLAHIFDYENRQREVEMVFPTVTKCSMKTFGVSGKVVEHHGICTLPINIVNEKIYVVMWFWFIILAGLTVLDLLLDVLILVLPFFRLCVFRTRFNFIPAHPIRHVLSHSSYGDYILLNIIGSNVDNNQMRHLVMSLSNRLGPSDNVSSTLPMYARQDGNYQDVIKELVAKNEANENEHLVEKIEALSYYS